MAHMSPSKGGLGNKAMEAFILEVQRSKTEGKQRQLRTQGFVMRTVKTDQTGQLPRLIWVFAERTVTLLVLSCRGSNFFFILGNNVIYFVGVWGGGIRFPWEAYMPYLTLWDKISQNLAHLEVNSYKILQISQNFQTILQHSLWRNKHTSHFVVFNTSFIH